MILVLQFGRLLHLFVTCSWACAGNINELPRLTSFLLSREGSFYLRLEIPTFLLINELLSLISLASLNGVYKKGEECLSTH